MGCSEQSQPNWDIVGSAPGWGTSYVGVQDLGGQPECAAQKRRVAATRQLACRVS